MHELIADLKRIALKLGKTPSRDEYVFNTLLGSRRKIDRVFGSYTLFLQASGLGTLDTPKSNTRENEIVKQRIARFYERSVDVDIPSKPFVDIGAELDTHEQTLCIPDLHCPWWDFDGVNRVLGLIKYFYKLGELKNIVMLGDMYDFYAASKFPRSQILMNPSEEVEKARLQLEWLWSEIHRIAPRTTKHALLGNHDLRPHKRLLESNSVLEAFYDFKPLFRFDSVHTHMDPRKPLVIGDVSFIHGFAQQFRHRAKLQTHVVHGHTHKGGLVHSKNPQSQRWLWELDCGYLGDPSSKPLTYTPVKELSWTKGCGYIGKFSPCFIPFG